MPAITEILSRMEQGESQAADELFPLVYQELRRLAASKMAHERPGQTLQPTALVHEAWLRLGADTQPAWQNRGHYFAAAAEAMRQILVEKARRRERAKHGGGMQRVALEDIDIAIEGQTDEHILEVNQALEKFTAVDPRKATLVKLRYFVGLSFEEAALALGIAVSTAKAWSSYARAWLSVELGKTLKL